MLLSIGALNQAAHFVLADWLPLAYLEHDAGFRHEAQNRCVGTKWEILDLKLPDDPLLTSGGFHPAFSSKLTRAAQQLRNYREYFSRYDTKGELIARVGNQPLDPRVAVLIGRRGRADNFERAQGSAALDVEVITYDDIVEFEESRLVLQAQLAGLLNRQ